MGAVGVDDLDLGGVPLAVALLGGGDADFDARFQGGFRSSLSFRFGEGFFVVDVGALDLDFAEHAILPFHEYPAIRARRGRAINEYAAKGSGGSRYGRDRQTDDHEERDNYSLRHGTLDGLKVVEGTEKLWA